MTRRVAPWVVIGTITLALVTVFPGIAKGKPDPERVKVYQSKLLALGYWLPEINGEVDRDTKHAVIAFQKVAGLKRTGEIDMPTKKAIEKGIRPKPRQSASYRVVEIDLERQVMLLVKGKEIRWIIDVSTGKPSTPTKRGWSKIYRKYDGLRASQMYRPTYFWRSAAIHGYHTVPEYAASHGCVRVTHNAMDFLWHKEALPYGMPLYIY